MSFKVEVKGLERLRKSFIQLEADIKKGGVAAVQESTFLLHETAVKLIQQNTDGTPDIRYAPKRAVVVSKPGDPPNTDTGRLVQSIKFDFKNKGLTGRVGTNLKYGFYLEFGTTQMAARPWLSTALDDTAKEVSEIFERNVKGELPK